MALVAAIVGVLVLGLTAVLLVPRAPSPPAAKSSTAAPGMTAAVVRTTLISHAVVTGTLGYFGTFVIIGNTGGVLTRAPSVGVSIGRGQPIYSVNDVASYLFYGETPAWRDYSSRTTAGPDVASLSANLVALGFLHPSQQGDRPSWSITQAVRRWQQSVGLKATGELPLGSIVYLPGPIRIANTTAIVGAPTDPGAPIATATSTDLGVTVALDPTTAATLRAGDEVHVTTPDNVDRGAVVLSISTVAEISTHGGDTTATVAVQVAFSPAWTPTATAVDQAPVALSITVRQVSNALAVPVTALLGEPGGGYAVETTAGGTHTFVAVTLGLFDDLSGFVQITGGSLRPGERVIVAAS